MKALISFVVFLVALSFVPIANAEYRTVLVHVTHSKDGKPQVTIRSDVKDEQKDKVSIDDGCAIIKKMLGWGSSVGVSVVLEKGLDGGDAEKLLKVIRENHWLGLTYLGPDMPKQWAGLVTKEK
jgi:hypothetical protein